MIRRNALGCVLLVGLGACGSRAAIDEPIAGVTPGRQRTVSRAEFGFRWPLSVGAGTLACTESGAILFRALGVTYVLSGRHAGALDARSLQLPEPSPPPSRPLVRLRQDERMEAFHSMRRCETRGRVDEDCRRSALARFGLSPAEWALIDREGNERRWPPLDRGLMSLDPLIVAGRGLCTSAPGR